MDDSTMLQDKIDALSNAGGGALELERRIYTLSRPIILPGTVTISGFTFEEDVMQDC